ncbi:hypothetical protein [Bacillus massiliigorillae]|nr:hypothetical protein [Bacillus massiliigorillae]
MRVHPDAKWLFLYKWEDGQKVYSFEPLRKYQLHNRLKQGWKLIS